MAKNDSAGGVSTFPSKSDGAPAFAFGLILTVAFASLFPGATRAATVVSDDFNDGNDQGWTHYDPLASFGAPGTFTVSGGSYRLQAAISPDPGTLGAGRAGSLRLDTNSGDFFTSVDIVAWDDNADQAFGLLSRIREVGLGTTDGYGFLYVPADHNFEMERFDNEADHRIGPIISITLDPARDYRITFAGTGDRFTGEVFDLADLTTPLLVLDATDGTYTTGVSGLLVADASPSGVVSDATFDNYLSTVPEPASVLLLLGGLFFISPRGSANRLERSVVRSA